MTDSIVKRLALILAVQAEIEGMKAQNQGRKLNKHDPAFWLDDFQAKANKLREIANKTDDFQNK